MSQSLEFKIPEGYVFDKDNSSNNVIRFKPIKEKITYQDIINNIKAKNIGISVQHGLTKIGTDCFITSEKQLEQLLAINKLMNVAKYLNGDWKINWRSKQEKYYIVYDYWNYVLKVTSANCYRSTLVYFESPSLAKQAIEILGEEEVKKALGIFE